MISVDVAQVRRAADEADYRANHHYNQSSQRRVVHEGYPVHEEGLVRGFDLHRILRAGDNRRRLIARTHWRMHATLDRGRKRGIRETMINHVPLCANDDPHHRRHRDKATSYRSLGGRPGHQHPQ